MAFHIIQLTNIDKKVIFEGEICFLPIIQQVLDQRCMAYYQEQVCTIRKENMRRLMYLEIEDALFCRDESQSEYNRQKKMPDIVKEMLDYKEQVLFYKLIE